MRAIYNLNFNRLIMLLLPMLLRKSSVEAFLQIIITPVITLQNTFDAFRRKTIYELNINGQTCYLQKMLNDNFDIDKRRITIKEANSFQRLYIYTPQEKKPIYLYTPQENKPVYFFNKEDFEDSGFDFYIILNGVKLTPQQLVLMHVLTDKYKLVTKKYTIQ